MNSTVKGYLSGIIAAVCYGTNPLGVLLLYREGINSNSAVFYRYVLAMLILGGMMLIQHKPFGITRKELGIVIVLGILFSASSLTLFLSFNYMDAGVASTMLFVYPVLVAVLMIIFFHEKPSIVTGLSICLALGGIMLLYHGDNGATLSLMGVMMVMLSSLTYAVYIILVNKSSLRMSSIKLTFYITVIGTIAIGLFSIVMPGNHLQWLSSPSMWLYALILALLPTIISLVMMTIAIHEVGSTPAAIMGALEPVTAVIIGITIFGEAFTERLAIGIVMILSAVILIIIGKSFSMQSFTDAIVFVGNKIKRWRWK
jgi:drug/metabolite transporter (DMT)-like permease